MCAMLKAVVWHRGNAFHLIIEVTLR